VRIRFIVAATVVLGCASGPRDTLDRTSHDVQLDASAPRAGAYAYVARRALVAVGLAEAHGISDDEAHRIVDSVADEATACLRRSKTLNPGAAHIVLPIDDGGITSSPQTEFSPPAAALQGMLCILAPLRLSTFTPDKTTGARSLTIEAAWGSDLTP
jgi:hypothetical protein